MIKVIYKKIANVKYKKEKKRLILFGVLLLLLLFFSFSLLGSTYARYQSEAKLNANIEQAIYIFDREQFSFNIDSSKIVPSNTPYSYKFSVSNYDSSRHSDVDISYKIMVKTTTNLPLTMRMYKDLETTNILSIVQVLQDADGSWYRVYELDDSLLMNYSDSVKHIFTFEVDFPISYVDDLTYAEKVENIEIILKSSQVV